MKVISISRGHAARSRCTFNTPSIDETCRIDVDKREHLELLRKSHSLKTNLHRFLYRRTIGAENLVPQRPVGIVARMDLALMMSLLVETSRCTFLRNGVEYDSKRALNHIKRSTMTSKARFIRQKISSLWPPQKAS